MSAILHVITSENDLKIVLSTAAAQTVESVIKNRLTRGDHTPLLFHWQNGQKEDRVTITSIEDYTVTFSDDGEPGATAEGLARDLAAADQAIAERGYLRLNA